MTRKHKNIICNKKVTKRLNTKLGIQIKDATSWGYTYTPKKIKQVWNSNKKEDLKQFGGLGFGRF
jgi:hypothetical protein